MVVQFRLTNPGPLERLPEQQNNLLQKTKTKQNHGREHVSA
jgi:hypothetical protein